MRAPIGEVAFEINPVEKVNRKRRVQVRREIRSCRRCSLVDSAQAPVPMTGAHYPRFAILGEAPGADEDKAGEPFVGRAGKFLRGVLMNVGVGYEEVVRFNTVCCWPHAGEATRSPHAAEVNACRPNLEAQLDALNTRYIVLAGGSALTSFRHDFTGGTLGIMAQHGRVFVWLDRFVVMPVVHPAFVLRKVGGKKAWIARLTEAFKSFVEMIDDLEDGGSILSYLGVRCVRCQDGAKFYDRDAVPHCRKHWEMWGGLWQRSRELGVLGNSPSAGGQRSFGFE